MKEYKKDINYVVCPDKKCGSFFTDDFLCEKNCPYNCQFFIICGCCGEKIYFNPKLTSIFTRIDCNNQLSNNKFNCGGCNFTRMSGRYEIIYKEDLK